MTQSTDEKREDADREEYLVSYDISAYDRPSVTADAVISDPAGRILLVKRKNHPYKGCWALPGGFVNRNETTAEAAVREAAEETGVLTENARLVGVYSAPGRDPRGWIISAAYALHIEKNAAAQGGDDAAEARWFYPCDIPFPLAFDHEEILKDAGICRDAK